MNDDRSNSPQGQGQISLRALLGIVALACVFLAITHKSVLAATMVVAAFLLATASLFIRRVRGEIVVLVLVGVPLLILALGSAWRLLSGE